MVAIDINDLRGDAEDLWREGVEDLYQRIFILFYDIYRLFSLGNAHDIYIQNVWI